MRSLKKKLFKSKIKNMKTLKNKKQYGGMNVDGAAAAARKRTTQGNARESVPVVHTPETTIELIRQKNNEIQGFIGDVTTCLSEMFESEMVLNFKLTNGDEPTVNDAGNFARAVAGITGDGAGGAGDGAGGAGYTDAHGCGGDPPPPAPSAGADAGGSSLPPHAPVPFPCRRGSFARGASRRRRRG